MTEESTYIKIARVILEEAFSPVHERRGNGSSKVKAFIHPKSKECFKAIPLA